MFASAGVNFTKICLPRKKMPTYCFWQKSRSSISPIIDSPDYRLKSVRRLQICALFAKKAYHLVSCEKADKPRKYVGEIDPW
jgi:hypothetical protein